MLALLVALAVSAPATLSSGIADERPLQPILDVDAAPTTTRLAQADIDPNAPDHAPTFIEQYLAFTISPVPSKQVSDGLVLSHVIGYVCFPACGGLWGPLVAVKDAEMTGDVALSWFVSGLLWGGISLVASITIVGGVMWLVLPYLATTSTLNALDRGIKKRGLELDRTGQPVGKGNSGKATKPPSSSTPAPNPTPRVDEPPPPSYAY